MNLVLRRLRMGAAISSFVCMTAFATAQAPVSGLQKQFDRIDLGIGGIGILTHETEGPDHLLGNTIIDKPGNTLGALINIRYIKSPLIGLEFNVNYSKYVQNYSGTTDEPNGSQIPLILGIQADAVEYSFGWVFHTPKIFGIPTYVSVGAGSTDFVPSRGGGHAFLPQARATYYYSAGVEKSVFSPHFGLRAGFRQGFFLAPDFETNYLTNLKHTYTTEPTAGFYFHF
jgi:hypothetical protein